MSLLAYLLCVCMASTGWRDDVIRHQRWVEDRLGGRVPAWWRHRHLRSI